MAAVITRAVKCWLHPKKFGFSTSLASWERRFRTPRLKPVNRLLIKQLEIPLGAKILQLLNILFMAELPPYLFNFRRC